MGELGLCPSEFITFFWSLGGRKGCGFFLPAAVVKIIISSVPKHAPRYPLAPKEEGVSSEINNLLLFIYYLESPEGAEHLLL